MFPEKIHKNIIMTQSAYSALALEKTIRLTNIKPDDGVMIVASKFAGGISLKVSLAVLATFEFLARTAGLIVASPLYFFSKKTFTDMTSATKSAAKTILDATAAIATIRAAQSEKRHLEPAAPETICGFFNDTLNYAQNKKNGVFATFQKNPETITAVVLGTITILTLYYSYPSIISYFQNAAEVGTHHSENALVALKEQVTNNAGSILPEKALPPPIFLSDIVNLSRFIPPLSPKRVIKIANDSLTNFNLSNASNFFSTNASALNATNISKPSESYISFFLENLVQATPWIFQNKTLLATGVIAFVPAIYFLKHGIPSVNNIANGLFSRTRNNRDEKSASEVSPEIPSPTTTIPEAGTKEAEKGKEPEKESETEGATPKEVEDKELAKSWENLHANNAKTTKTIKNIVKIISEFEDKVEMNPTNNQILEDEMTPEEQAKIKDLLRAIKHNFSEMNKTISETNNTLTKMVENLPQSSGACSAEENSEPPIDFPYSIHETKRTRRRPRSPLENPKRIKRLEKNKQRRERILREAKLNPLK